MATRTSTRHAAQKAKEAIASSPDTKRRGSVSAKRKGSAEKGPEPKRGKKEGHDETEEVHESVPEGPVNTGENEVTQASEMPEEKTEEKVEEKVESKKPQESTGGEQGEGTEDKLKTIDEQGEGREDKGEEESKPVDQSEIKPEKASEQESELKPEEIESQVKSEEKEDRAPPNVLEKGIIYFFYRPRVNVPEPQGMSDVARSFFVLRPTPLDAALDYEKGPLDVNAKCRLLMVPKKRFPTYGKEREMGFVESAGKSIKEIQESFAGGESYETATQGTRTVPAARPYAEGVYAITSTKRATHLVYMLTIPDHLGNVQEDFGLQARGSWLIQSKNPKYPGPPFAQLPKEPEYPESLREKFGDLRWIPMEPELIDYPHAQFLMVGSTKGTGEVSSEKPLDAKPAGEQAKEELIKMEDENEERIETLGGDHAIYADLGSQAQKFPKVLTAWESTSSEKQEE